MRKKPKTRPARHVRRVARKHRKPHRVLVPAGVPDPDPRLPNQSKVDPNARFIAE